MKQSCRRLTGLDHNMRESRKMNLIIIIFYQSAFAVCGNDVANRCCKTFSVTRFLEQNKDPQSCHYSDFRTSHAKSSQDDTEALKHDTISLSCSD